MEKFVQEFYPKSVRERFNQADVLPRKAGWPKPVGTAPRVGGMMGRVVRNAKGDVVTLTADADPKAPLDVTITDILADAQATQSALEGLD